MAAFREIKIKGLRETNMTIWLKQISRHLSNTWMGKYRLSGSNNMENKNKLVQWEAFIENKEIVNESVDLFSLQAMKAYEAKKENIKNCLLPEIRLTTS